MTSAVVPECESSCTKQSRCISAECAWQFHRAGHACHRVLPDVLVRCCIPVTAVMGGCRPKVTPALVLYVQIPTENEPIRHRRFTTSRRSRQQRNRGRTCGQQRCGVHQQFIRPWICWSRLVQGALAWDSVYALLANDIASHAQAAYVSVSMWKEVRATPSVQRAVHCRSRECVDRPSPSGAPWLLSLCCCSYSPRNSCPSYVTTASS